MEYDEPTMDSVSLDKIFKFLSYRILLINFFLFYSFSHSAKTLHGFIDTLITVEPSAKLAKLDINIVFGFFRKYSDLVDSSCLPIYSDIPFVKKQQVLMISVIPNSVI